MPASGLQARGDAEAPVWLQILSCKDGPTFEAKECRRTNRGPDGGSECGGNCRPAIGRESDGGCVNGRNAGNSPRTYPSGALKQWSKAHAGRRAHMAPLSGLWAMAGENAGFRALLLHWLGTIIWIKNMRSGDLVRLGCGMRMGSLHRRFGANGTGLWPL